MLLAACSPADGPDGRPTLQPAATSAREPGATTTPARRSTATASPDRSGGNAASAVEPPAGLALPFDVADMAGFISPFGLYRTSKDRPEFGHSGIDIPLRQGAPIYAVADGAIISVTPTVDHRPGSVVWLRIAAGDRGIKGWEYLYEHIDLTPGLVEGSTVRRGEAIGTNPIGLNAGNNHLQLSYAFNEQRFTNRHTCWVDQLDAPGRAALTGRFDEIRASEGFVQAWSTLVSDGMLAYRELLNAERFPDGAQLCYPPGTDVRESTMLRSVLPTPS